MATNKRIHRPSHRQSKRDIPQSIPPPLNVPPSLVTASTVGVKALRAMSTTNAVTMDTLNIGLALYEDVQETGKPAKKTVKTAASIGSGWLGGFGGAYLGNFTGTWIAGGVIGSVIGVTALPVVVAAGSFMGGLIGGVVGGLAGSQISDRIVNSVISGGAEAGTFDEIEIHRPPADQQRWSIKFAKNGHENVCEIVPSHRT